jgi:hypothetical protein
MDYHEYEEIRLYDEFGITDLGDYLASRHIPLEKVKKLDCRNCTRLISLAALHDLPNLRSVDCTGCTGLKTLMIHPNLVKLRIDGCIGLEKITLLDELESYKLRFIWCHGCGLLEDIPAFPNLEELDCGHCTKLINLPISSKLRLLCCTFCIGLKSLPELPNLEQLVCYDCTILKSLPKLPKLKNLYCGGCTILTSLPIFPELGYIDCENCTMLNMFTLSGSRKLYYVYAVGCTQLLNPINIPCLPIENENFQFISSNPHIPPMVTKKYIENACKAMREKGSMLQVIKKAGLGDLGVQIDAMTFLQFGKKRKSKKRKSKKSRKRTKRRSKKNI